MRKIIATMNMTLDGICDHTVMTADEDIHEHYNDLLRNAGALIYGRITYQLMESYWPLVVAQPTGNEAMDDFAVLINDIPKIVYSRSLQHVEWKNTTLKHEIIPEELLALKAQDGRPICVGSPSLIVALTNLGLIDEYQIGLQPTIIGRGLTLFNNIQERVDLTLRHTKTLNCGAVFLYYETNG